MSDTTAASGATATADSGATVSPDSGQNEPTTESIQTKTVSWDNHRRAIDDMHKHKKRSAELEQKLGDVESERLKEKEDYKGLAEREKNRADNAESELQNTVNAVIGTQKLAKVKELAQLAGLKKEAIEDLELLDLKDVEVEATSKDRFIVHHADRFVERLQTSKPHWFGKDKPPKINGGGGGVPPKTDKVLEATDVLEAERNFKRGKISQKEYHSVYEKWVKQRTKKT